MPMDFPDEKLARTAQLHDFREQKKGETLAEFRNALAQHVQNIDFIEACEIKFGVGWDKWTKDQQVEMLLLRCSVRSSASGPGFGKV